MFVGSIFFSLPLILTLLAASICHFLIPEFSFFFFGVVVVVVFSFALALSLLSASV